jgi:hypothetical protein
MFYGLTVNDFGHRQLAAAGVQIPVKIECTVFHRKPGGLALRFRQGNGKEQHGPYNRKEYQDHNRNQVGSFFGFGGFRKKCAAAETISVRFAADILTVGTDHG